jgi:hypothetical protein
MWIPGHTWLGRNDWRSGLDSQGLAIETPQGEHGREHQHGGAGQQRTKPAQACCGLLQGRKSQMGVAQESSAGEQAEPVGARVKGSDGEQARQGNL